MKNISQSEIKGFFVLIHGLPGFLLKSLFHDVLVIVFLLSEDIRLSEKDRVVPSIVCIGTCWANHRCSMTGQKILFFDFRTVCSKHLKM